jgi:hypothetical protein
MTMATVWANHLILDRVVTSADGDHVGMVDDIELSEPGQGELPVITAFLSGPTALGPRIGGRLGLWWLSIGRRLRPDDVEYPNRIPVEVVKTLDVRGVELTIPAKEVSTRRLHDWQLAKIILRIPGNGS